MIYTEEGRQVTMTSLTEEVDDDIKRRQEDDPLLQDFKDAGTTDPEYQDIIRHLKNETAIKDLKKTPSKLCGTQIPEHMEQDGPPESFR